MSDGQRFSEMVREHRPTKHLTALLTAIDSSVGRALAHAEALVDRLDGGDAFLLDRATRIAALLDGPVAAALAAIRGRPGPVVVVSDEVGGGIVPMHAGARAYRDLVGIVHQRLAADADEVVLTVAGLPLHLKGGAA